MFSNLKALAVVLMVALAIFAIAKPICLRFTKPEDFSRRRAVWIALTAVAFVSPSFWLYVLFAAPLLVWATRRDTNPLALYLLIYLVIPPMDIAIPTVGINQLFDLSQARLLGFFVLLPAIATRMRSAGPGARGELTTTDVLLLLFGALQLVLLFPYEAVTNTMRRGFLFVLDSYLVYYAFSRLQHRVGSFADTMSALTLSACILAPLAVFESSKGWLLYTGIGNDWGAPNVFAWLFRGGSLRAQVSTGHALGLGLVLATAMGFWLYLKFAQASKVTSASILGLLAAGLYVTYSRGPWLMAALTPFVFLALCSRNVSTFAKSTLFVCVLGGAVLATPLGSDIVERLPFVGKVEQDTVEYRQQLAETAWRLIKQNPLFGNPFVLLDMESLRQGQGIIDIVNGYISVALFYGVVGFGLYVGALASALGPAFRFLRRARLQADGDAIALGASLVACMVATLFYTAVAGPSWFQWALAGLMVSYSKRQSARALIEQGQVPLGQVARSVHAASR